MQRPMFADPWVEMHFQLGLRLSDEAAKRAPRFEGWDPDWQAKRAALVAKLSPEEQERTRQIDAELEEKRRRRGPFQRSEWN